MVFSKLMRVLAASGAIAFVACATADPAKAVTAEVAKKCRDLMIKAYPPPPTGSRQGNAPQERDYFRMCVAKGGNVNSGGEPTVGRGSQ